MSLYGPGEVRSLGAQTDLTILAGQGARITPREGYLAVATEKNPGYYWGNFLHFREAPRAGDLARWEQLFRHEFRFQPGVLHTAFSWDGDAPGEVAPFTSAGYDHDPGTVLTLGELRRPERAAQGLSVRELRGDAGWEGMISNQIACRPDGFELGPYELFKRRQATAYRALAERGAGDWWGAFLGDELVADCGLFFTGSLGRFQSVGTHPAWRRRGICAALIHEVSRRGLARGHTLVMVAGTDEPAERIYRSVGYVPTERQHGVCRRPSNPRL